MKWKIKHCMIIKYFVSQLITQNQERFVQMLNEPVEGAGQAQGGSSGGGSGGAPGGQSGGGPGGPDSGYIQVTPDEKQAIERVCILYSLCTLTFVHLQKS